MIFNSINIRKLLRHPLMVSLCSGFIICIVGTYLTIQGAKANLDRQMMLELYKDMIHQQSEFVDHLSKDVCARIYKLRSYFLTIESGSPKEIQESWERYKAETREWNNELKFYCINLDRFFPNDKFQIGGYAVAKDLFKNELSYSFRMVLEKDIQDKFARLNNSLNYINSKIVNNQKVPEEQKVLAGRQIDSLYKTIYEFMESLSKASEYYKISTKTRLLAHGI